MEKFGVKSKSGRAIGMISGILATGVIGGSVIANIISNRLINPLFGEKSCKKIFNERKPEAIDIGLHVDDIKRLMEVISRIADQGATVVIIEHNLDVIKLADYIIDLGPEGGNRGGNIIFAGTPEDLINVEGSYTAKYLKPYLLEE
jgi:hypothetical protein